MLEDVVEEMRSVLVEEEEEKGLKEEEMARVGGTCIGHMEPGRRVGAPSAPRPYCTRGPTPFKETTEKMIRKNRHKSTKSKQDYPFFFAFVLNGSAGTPSLAND